MDDEHKGVCDHGKELRKYVFLDESMFVLKALASERLEMFQYGMVLVY